MRDTSIAAITINTMSRTSELSEGLFIERRRWREPALLSEAAAASALLTLSVAAWSVNLVSVRDG